jgi:hypothetical protein
MRQKESNTPCIESFSHPEKSVNFPTITLARPHGMRVLWLCRAPAGPMAVGLTYLTDLGGDSKMEEGGFRTGTESKEIDNDINDHRTSGTNQDDSCQWFNSFFTFNHFYEST